MQSETDQRSEPTEPGSDLGFYGLYFIQECQLGDRMEVENQGRIKIKVSVRLASLHTF